MKFFAWTVYVDGFSAHPSCSVYEGIEKKVNDRDLSLHLSGLKILKS